MNFKNLQIKFLGHSGFFIQAEGENIYIDPYNLSSNEPEPADIILITHPHYDHCSIKDIQKIAKDGTIIIGPADIQSKITRLNNQIYLQIIEAGQTKKIQNIIIGTVPAYNPAKQFHPKEERWLGYLIKIRDITIYHAGDTDLIPEMSQLKGKVSLALLPVGGNMTMNSKEAAKAAELISPELAIPMHYSNEIVGSIADAEVFVKLCQNNNINAQILEKE